ncbi:MAG: amino acid permease [Acidobacteria bacterium]|nr:MAG: amino acid permease [Acidobacteriota bacterium]
MTTNEQLERHLTLSAAVAVVVAEVIAVGIFLAPSAMIGLLGSPLAVFGVWLGMGLMALSGALTYAELAVRYPRAGGPYVYLREAFGRDAAFLYGWMSLMVMDPGVTAALALGLSEYAAYALSLSVLQAKIIAVGSILLLAGANIFGARMGASTVKTLAALKVLLIIVIVAWSFGSGAGNWSHFAGAAAGPPGHSFWASVGGAFVLAFFAYGGWWDLSKLAGEVVDPARTIPRALVLGIGMITLFYLLLTAAFLYTVPPGQGGSGEAFGAEVGRRLFGASGARIVAGMVVVSIVGSMAGVLFAAPRVYFAMGRDRLFLPAIGRLNSRFGTPVAAIGIQAALASVMVAWSTFAQLVGYFVFVAVIFIGLGAASVFVLRKRVSRPVAYLAWGYPLTTVVFLGCVVGLAGLLFIDNPIRSLVGLFVVALGWPARRLMERAGRERRPSERTAGRGDAVC